jgi:TFIIF-interacting CTD phosphatase-like protein
MLFAAISLILLENENIWFCLRRQKILSAENNVGVNRDDTDHILIITIDVDHMKVHSVTRYKISQNPVGHIQISARHVILDKLFIGQ